MVSHGEGGLVSLMKRSWVKKIQAPTTSPNTAVCLCGCRCWNRPLEALTLALFTLAEAFKHTTHRQCQQLYLCLHVDGVLFPVSLQDEVVGSTSLPRSICIHSTHGSAEIWERGKQRARERAPERKYCLTETASHGKTGGKDGEREKRKKWECSRRREGEMNEWKKCCPST